MLWLTNAKILDVERGRYRSGALVIDGERILEITRKSVAPKGAKAIDLAGRYLLPGLMDCHVHLTLPTDTADPYEPARRGDALDLRRIARRSLARGGEPIEAGSSLLWLPLLVALSALPFHLAVSAKLVGWGFGVLNLWLVHRISRQQIESRLLALAPVFATAVATPFVMHQQRALETPLYTTLVLSIALCCSDARLRRWWLVPAVLLLPAALSEEESEALIQQVMAEVNPSGPKEMGRVMAALRQAALNRGSTGLDMGAASVRVKALLQQRG